MPFLGNTKSADTFIGFGLNEIFDCELRDSRLSGDNSTTFDASANLVAPILGVSPGISVGVVDALNRTSDGRRAYVAITFREYLETATNDYATETTIGMQYGSLTTPFVAMSIPVSKNFRFLAEHNGFRLTGGFEIKPFPSIGIKLLAQERGVLGSVSWTAKF